MAADLSETDRALWAAVARTVTPLGGRPADLDPDSLPPLAVSSPLARTVLSTPTAQPTSAPSPPQLDGGWERRLAKGLVKPDRTVDLHGLRLDSAWERLDRVLEEVVASGGRVLLVIAGRDRGTEVRVSPGARGQIRAKLPDWLHAGRHSGCILAVRPAHQRHGGAGAVYLVLKRTQR